MPPVNRNAPQRAESSDSTYSFMEFSREFPDDAACLDYIWRTRFAADGHHTHCPKCDRPRKFHRVKDRPAYDCDSCGYHLHPLKGTIFQKSPTSLHLWFYAMYLMSVTRCGVSAKQIERELGVTYKTAWRMLNLIRNQLMGDDVGRLTGDVEVDETYVGGKPRANSTYTAGRPTLDSHKTPVLGMVERGGKVVASTVPNVRATTIMPQVSSRVLPGSMIYTDEYVVYDHLPKKLYRHRRIPHAEKVYVAGTVHTQTIEGFFSLVKNGIRGTYHSVSRKWLQGYLNEFAWRYNRRDDRRAMFESLLFRAAT